MIGLPSTWYGQLFTLAHDRRRGRFDGDDRWRFGLALRTAMLAELCFNGHLADEGDRPCPVGDNRPRDPLLQAALHEIAGDEPKDWTNAVARDQRNVPGTVRSHLEAAGCRGV